MAYRPAELEAELLNQKPYDAADTKAVNEARKAAARKAKKLAEVTKAIMSTPQGRMWMYELIVACNPLGNPIVANDTHLTFAMIGQQNIGKKILQDIDAAAAEEYVVMMREARERTS